MELSARDLRHIAKTIKGLERHPRDLPILQMPMQRPLSWVSSNDGPYSNAVMPSSVDEASVATAMLQRHSVVFWNQTVDYYEVCGGTYAGTLDDLACIGDVVVIAHPSIPRVGVGFHKGQIAVILPMAESTESKMARRRDFGDRD